MEYIGTTSEYTHTINKPSISLSVETFGLFYFYTIIIAITHYNTLSAREDIEFQEARPILYLNTAAVASLFNSRNMNTTANRSNWSTIISYLKSHSSFLGLKQDRFTILLPSGLPDYSFELINGEQVKKVKVNRPKALCFDYLQLKDSFGLDLETEVVADTQDSEDM